MKSILLAIIGLFVLEGTYAQYSHDYGNNEEHGKYISNDGVKIYYESYGEGKPLMIFHGNTGSIAGRSDWIEKFSKEYRVIIMDNRCHGKSDCPEGEVTYRQMASDVDLIMEDLNIENAYAWGHSDGGNIALLVAINYPERFEKIIASGSNLRPDTLAVDPDVIPVIEKMEASVKGNHRGIKQVKLLTDYPNIKTEELSKIQCKTLLIFGDRDVILPQHALEIYHGIGHENAFLCILPGTTHMVFKDRSEWFDQIFNDFLNNTQQTKTTAQLWLKMFE